ncbi:hypothetical protein [Prauserella alba]|nr:hypothetical protein [Prauserella alba]MCP2182316.1 hypothetical protein [Prauserella alba]
MTDPRTALGTTSGTRVSVVGVTAVAVNAGVTVQRQQPSVTGRPTTTQP